jgi:hypothetical protein
MQVGGGCGDANGQSDLASWKCTCAERVSAFEWGGVRLATVCNCEHGGHEEQHDAGRESRHKAL